MQGTTTAATDHPWIAAIRLSDSFRVSVGEVATELGADLLECAPAGAERPPAGAALVLVLAGGEESLALDLLPVVGNPLVPVFLVGSSTDYRLAAAALQRGARDYFALPDDLELLRRSLERELREARGRQAAARFADAERHATGFGAILGRSPDLQRVLSHAARVAAHGNVSVLIGGETGTGKELLARAIHYASPRGAAPFIEINCAAIPANLLESELFGHEKGAFTGAVAARAGLMELAHGGTLFLDEVGGLPLELQPKLLRALEGREIRRVGGLVTRHVDIRLIGATHVDLAAAVRRGEFREDLYYRLQVVVLTLPPLRDRDGDVELLAETFLTRLATSYGLPVPPLGAEAKAALRAHRWPGNVRELRNTIERALVLSPPGTLRTEELAAPKEPAVGPDPSGLPFPTDLATLTRAAVVRMLGLTGGNKSEAARRLGISRPRLQRLLDGLNDE
jgi:DNA-binding NtrC family response regulator